MLRLLTLVPLLLFASAAQAQAAPSFSDDAVHLKVTDTSGAVIGKAQIRVTAKPILLETDANGTAFFNLHSFRFELEVKSPGFTPQNQLLNGSESQPQTIHLTVHSCPPTCEPFPHSALYIYKYPQPEGARTVTYEPSEFARLPHQSVTVAEEQTHKKEVYSGVLLSALLPLIGAPRGEDFSGPAFLQYLVAAGQDGFRVLIPLAETEPAFYPGVVLVADRLNGKPLSARDGPFKLIISRDRCASRWVRHLSSIELRQAE